MCSRHCIDDRTLFICVQSPLGVMHFEGGETAALARLQDYFWNKVILSLSTDVDLSQLVLFFYFMNPNGARPLCVCFWGTH